MTRDRPSLDIALVSGRRPELLARTLASFGANLFPGFAIGGVFANIDPVFGHAADQAACRDLVLSHFPHARVFEPATPGFAAAVQRVWGATTGDLVFHLEDDWELNEPLTPDDILPLMVDDTRSVAPVSVEMGWDGQALFNQRRRRKRLLGIPVGRTVFNVFGTSPRFLEGGFARRCAALMDPALDPEKQMRRPGNPALIAHQQPFRCRLLPGRTRPDLITDIGRGWREARGIEKVVSAGVSTWTDPK
jgi:hypothetical protein